MTTQFDAPVVARRATDADREAALALISPSTARGRASLALLRAGQGILWVAVEQGAERETLVGLLLATAQLDADDEVVVGYIHELLVHPAYRRRGVAGELLDAAERYFLIDCGFGVVSVTTSFDNDAAIRIYRSRGYAISQARLTKRREDTEPGATEE